MASGLGLLTGRHIAIMEERGLDREMLSRLGVESAAMRGPGQWVRYPFAIGERIVNHKYRRLDQKDFRQSPGGLKCFWNFNSITDPSLADEPLIITEGEDDAIVLMQCGFQRVVSVPDGAPGESIPIDDVSKKYNFLEHAREALKRVERIILVTDADQPGLVLRGDLAVRLGRARCQQITMGEHKDIRDLYLAEGVKAVQTAIDAAVWWNITGLFLDCDELPARAYREPHEIGIPGLGKHYRIRRGDFCVMTGIPGHGKTSLLNDIACRMAARHGWGTCFASFEQEAQTEHMDALRVWRRCQPDLMQEERESAAVHAFIKSHFSFIVAPEDEAVTLPWLLERAATAIIRRNRSIVMLDPWNELDHAKPRDQSMTEFVGSCIREMKKFAREMNVHMIVAAHPAKMGRDKDGDTLIPTLYDISDSANWNNKPDVGIIIHRETAGATLLRVAKIRHQKEVGVPGDVRLLFIPETCRYEAAP